MVVDFLPIIALLDPHRRDSPRALSSASIGQGNGSFEITRDDGRIAVNPDLQVTKNAGQRSIGRLPQTTARCPFLFGRIVTGEHSSGGTKGTVARKMLIHKGIDLAGPGQHDVSSIGRLHILGIIPSDCSRQENGNQTEIDALNGEIIRIANDNGLDAPYNKEIMEKIISVSN